jgi:Flp pilus assembly pilin Flp
MKLLKLGKTNKRQYGQGMTEYIIIVALIAVAAIGTFSAFGGAISDQVGAMAMEISGQKGADAIKKSQTQAKSAVTKADRTKSLSDYADDSNAK